MFKDNSRTASWPMLPLPGTFVAALLLLLLSFIGVRLGALSVLLSALCGVLLSAILLLHRTPLSLIIPILCAVLSVIAAPNLFFAAIALLFLPIGYSIAFSVYRGFPRMKAVVFVGTVTALVTLLLLSGVFFLYNIPPSLFFSEMKEMMIASLTAPTAIGENGVAIPILTVESASLLLRYTVLMTPALFICTFFLLAYFTTALLWKILSFLTAVNRLLPSGWHMIPSRTHATVYLVSNLITFLAATTHGGEVYYYAFYNVSLVFLLPLSVFGLITLFRKIKSAPEISRFKRIALVVFACMILISGLYQILTVLAFYGAHTVFHTKKAFVSNDRNPSL